MTGEDRNARSQWGTSLAVSLGLGRLVAQRLKEVMIELHSDAAGWCVRSPAPGSLFVLCAFRGRLAWGFAPLADVRGMRRLFFDTLSLYLLGLWPKAETADGLLGQRTSALECSIEGRW